MWFIEVGFERIVEALLIIFDGPVEFIELFQSELKWVRFEGSERLVQASESGLNRLQRCVCEGVEKRHD